VKGSSVYAGIRYGEYFIPAFLGVILGVLGGVIFLLWLFPLEIGHSADSNEGGYKAQHVLFSEHVSAVSWVDASAPCYGTSHAVSSRNK
jgi:hypothetical protein